MATSADTSRAAQAAIAAQAARTALKAFPDIDLGALRTSLPQFKLVVAAMVHRYGPAAGAAALQFYRERRTEAGVPGRPALKIAKPPNLGRIGGNVDWATAPLWGVSDTEAAKDRIEAVVEQFVLDMGRNTIIDAVHDDKQAVGWARITEPDPCYFCALMASRGANYRSQKRASFEPHDHCRCHAEPIFGEYEPSAQVREWQAMYEGLKNRSLIGFRREYEGRTDPNSPTT